MNVNGIEPEKGNVNEHEKEIEKGTGISDDRLVAIEVGGRENIGVVARTDHTEIAVEIVIVIKIVIEIGNAFFHVLFN